MPYRVFLTNDAANDLEELVDFIEKHDSPKKAQHIIDKIEGILSSSTESSERGPYPKELLALGIKEYRQLFFKPYWLIYRVIGKKVYVMVIADGRRDMGTLLQRRLLQA